MKKILLVICVLWQINLLGQCIEYTDYSYSFDNENWNQKIIFNQDSANIWQIGSPQKINFNESISQNKVIVTDTLNSYPINDTSFFVLNHLSPAGSIMDFFSLSGRYYVASDTLVDFGKIEISFDLGNSWIDLLNNNLGPSTWFPLPVLTGHSSGWQFFQGYISIPTAIGYQACDTIKLKFSFISDSIETNQDGLMFDDLNFIDVYIGIEDLSSNQIKIYPNPSSNFIKINNLNLQNSIHGIELRDNLGHILNTFDDKTDEIDISNLEPGFYSIVFKTNQGLIQKSFVKE